MRDQESYFTTLGGGLVALGIVFNSEPLVGYSFMGAGMLLSIISAIKAKKEIKKR